MEVGRSKGVYTIFGFQDIAQINQLYPPHESQKWAALFGLRVFPQVVGRDSQDWVCGQIGDQEVQYLQKSVSGQGDGKQNVSMSYSQPTIRPVLLSSELELFGKRKNGIETLFLGLGGDALALTVPFIKVKELRAAHVPWPTITPPPPPAAPLAEGEANHSEAMAERETDGNVTPFPAGHGQTETTPTASADEETQTNEMLQILDSFPTPETPPTEEKGETPEDEILGNVAENIGEHVLADVIGIPSAAIDLFEMLDNLQAPETQNIQAATIITTTKKRERKARKYESSNQQ